MKCPWLINTVCETNNRNSYNDARRSEKQEFGSCVGNKCPFFRTIDKKERCLRAESIYVDKLFITDK